MVMIPHVELRNCNSNNRAPITQKNNTHPITSVTANVTINTNAPPQLEISTVLLASLGGILYGYDMGVISGALPQLQETFQLSNHQTEMVVSLLYIGGCIGAAVGGYMCDVVGRRTTILTTDLLFISSTLLLSITSSLSLLLFSRFLLGIAISIIAIADVTYLHELCPTVDLCGIIVSIHECCISAGFLISYGVSYLFKNQKEGWRWMFSFGIIIASVQFIGMFSRSESVVWLQERMNYTQNHTNTMDLLFHTYWKQMMLVISLAITSQFSGHVNVLNYGPELFLQIQNKYNEMDLMVWLGIIKFLFTCLVVWNIESFGRRVFLLGGMCLMVVSLVFLTCAFVMFTSNYYKEDSNYPQYAAIIGIFGIVIGYSTSFGPLNWLLITDLFPSIIKGRALGISTIAVYLSASLVSHTFVSVQNIYGRSVPFILYLVWMMGSVIFVGWSVPETKGKTWEESEEVMKRMWFWKKIGSWRQHRNGDEWVMYNTLTEPNLER